MDALQYGQRIKVRAFGGKVLDRRVVGVRDGFVLICSDEEYSNASSEQRPPSCVGFPESAIVSADATPVTEMEEEPAKRPVRSEKGKVGLRKSKLG